MTKRIFRSILAVSVAVLLGSLVLIVGVLHGYFQGRVMAELESRTAYVAHGVELDGVALAPAQVDRLGPNLLSFRIHEGKNRQIRRMCQQVGLTVKALRRVREGQVQLGGLKLGKWRYLTEEEVALLKAL